jgi:hypothetical protein
MHMHGNIPDSTRHLKPESQNQTEIAYGSSASDELRPLNNFDATG